VQNLKKKIQCEIDNFKKKQKSGKRVQRVIIVRYFEAQIEGLISYYQNKDYVIPKIMENTL